MTLLGTSGWAAMGFGEEIETARYWFWIRNGWEEESAPNIPEDCGIAAAIARMSDLLLRTLSLVNSISGTAAETQKVSATNPCVKGPRPIGG